MPTRVRIVFSVFVVTLSSSLALRSYTLTATSIKCITNASYVANVSCTVDNSLSYSRINIEGQLTKQIKDVLFNFFVNLERPNKESVSVFKATSLDACRILTKNSSVPIINMYMDVMSKAGPMPAGCPVPVGFQFKFQNISLDPEYLPSYMPAAKFKIIIDMLEKRKSFWHTTTFGKVVYKNEKRKVQKNS